MKSGFEYLRRISGSKQPDNYGYVFDNGGNKMDKVICESDERDLLVSMMQAAGNSPKHNAQVMINSLGYLSGVPYKTVLKEIGMFKFVPETLDEIFQMDSISIADKISALLVYISADYNIRKCEIKKAIYKAATLDIRDDKYDNYYFPESKFANEKIMKAFISNRRDNIKKSNTMIRAFHSIGLDEIAFEIIDTIFSDDKSQVKDVLYTLEWKWVIRPRLLIRSKQYHTDWVVGKYCKYMNILSIKVITAFKHIVDDRKNFDRSFAIYGEGMTDEEIKALKIRFIENYTNMQMRALINNNDYDGDAVVNVTSTHKIVGYTGPQVSGDIIDELDLIDLSILRYPTVKVNEEFFLRNFNTIKTDKNELVNKLENYLFCNIDKQYRAIYCTLFSMDTKDIVKNFYKLKPTLEDIGYVPGREPDQYDDSIWNLNTGIIEYVVENINDNGHTTINTAMAFVKWVMFDSQYYPNKEMFTDLVKSLVRRAHNAHKRDDMNNEYALEHLQDFSRKLVKTMIHYFKINSTNDKQTDLVTVGLGKILDNIYYMYKIVGDQELYGTVRALINDATKYTSRFTSKELSEYRRVYALLAYDLLTMFNNDACEDRIKDYGRMIGVMLDYISTLDHNVYYSIPYKDGTPYTDIISSMIIGGSDKIDVDVFETITDVPEALIRNFIKHNRLNEETLDLLF